LTVGELVATLRLDEAPFWRDLRRIQARVKTMGAAKVPVEVDNDRLTRSTDRADRDLSRLGRSAGRVRLNLGAYARGLGLVAGLSTAVGVGTGALVAALGAGAVAAAGAAAAGVALGQGLGVLTAITHGVGDAMKAAAEGDAEKLKEALKGLSPEARRFVLETRPITKALGDMRREMQDAAFPGFTSGVQRLAGAWLPVLRREGVATAGMFGTLAVQASRAMSTKAFTKDLATIGESNRRVLRDLGLAALEFGDGLRHVLVMGAPVAEWMAGKAKQGAAQFADAMASLRMHLPAIGGWLRDAADGARELAGVGWDKAKAGLQGIVTIAGKIEEKFDLSGLATKLVEDAKKLAGDIVAGIKTGLEEGDWGPLGDTLGRAIGDSIASKAALIGEGVRRLMSDVNWSEVGKQAAMIAVPFVVGFVNGLTDAIITQVREHPLDTAVFIATLIPVGRIAGGLAKLFGKLPILGPLLKSLEGAGKLVEKPVGSIIRGIGRGFSTGFARIFPEASGGVRRGIAGILGSIDSRHTAFVLRGRRLIVGFGEGIGSAAGRVVSAGARVARASLGPFAGAPGWLIGRGRQLVAGFASGARANAGAAVSAMVSVGARARGAVAGAPGWLVARGRQLVGGFASGARSNIGAVVGALVALGAAARGAVAGAGSWLYNAGRQVISGFISGIQSMIGNIRSSLSQITSMIPRIKGPPERDRRLLEPSGRLIMAGLMSGIAAGRRPLERQLAGITRGIAGAAVGAAAGAGAAGGGGDLAGALAALADQPIILEVDSREVARASRRGSPRLGRVS
jgi:hypothetical protein